MPGASDGGVAFEWAPLLSAVYRGELPRRLCAPLGSEFRSPLSLLRLHSHLLPRAVAGLADLQVIFLPPVVKNGCIRVSL